MEQQARKALAARGMSAAGIAASVAINHRHDPAIRATIQHGRAAEAALSAALAKRPIDVEGFAAAMTARANAAAGLQREAAQELEGVDIEERRGTVDRGES